MSALDLFILFRPVFFSPLSLDLSSVNSQNPWRQHMAACQALWVLVLFHWNRRPSRTRKSQRHEAGIKGGSRTRLRAVEKRCYKKEGEREEKKSRARLEPQGRDTLPRRCDHILTLPPLMRPEGASGILNREAGGTSKTGLRPAPPSGSPSEDLWKAVRCCCEQAGAGGAGAGGERWAGARKGWRSATRIQVMHAHARGGAAGW